MKKKLGYIILALTLIPILVLGIMGYVQMCKDGLWFAPLIIIAVALLIGYAINLINSN